MELIETIDPKDRYLTELRSKIDVDAIRKSGLRIAIDSLYGTSRDYLDYFLLEAGLEVKIIHNFRDPYFGGFSPECNEKNLIELRNLILAEGYDLGLATDETTIIGDTVETDILGGVQLGYHTVLVLSGGTRPEDLQRYAYRPEIVVDSLAR